MTALKEIDPLVTESPNIQDLAVSFFFSRNSVLFSGKGEYCQLYTDIEDDVSQSHSIMLEYDTSFHL